MFEKLAELFRSLIESIFGGGKGKEKPTPKPKEDILPEVKDDDPQDGSDITPDTLVIVDNEEDPEIFEEEEEEEPPSGEEEEIEETIEEEPKHKARYLWCLDNGHGELTAGKRSPLFDDGETRFFEYEFNRDIVKRIIKELEKVGVQYFNVVPEVDVDNFLKERVSRANNKKSDLPKIFVSVHSNAAPASSSKNWAPASVKGIETWYFHNSRKGKKIASIFQKFLIEKTGWKNRHIKSRSTRQFYVLSNTNMTAVLTENGFYNNKREAIELMKPGIRQKIANAHVAAILEIEETGL